MRSYHLQMFCLLYSYKLYVVHPFLRWSFSEKVRECFHLPHILMWISIPGTVYMIWVVLKYSVKQSDLLYSLGTIVEL